MEQPKLTNPDMRMLFERMLANEIVLGFVLQGLTPPARQDLGLKIDQWADLALADPIRDEDIESVRMHARRVAGLPWEKDT